MPLEKAAKDNESALIWHTEQAAQITGLWEDNNTGADYQLVVYSRNRNVDKTKGEKQGSYPGRVLLSSLFVQYVTVQPTSPN